MMQILQIKQFIQRYTGYSGVRPLQPISKWGIVISGPAGFFTRIMQGTGFSSGSVAAAKGQLRLARSMFLFPVTSSAISAPVPSGPRRLSATLLLAVLFWFAGPLPAPAQLQVPAIPSNSQLANQYEYSAEYAYRVDLDGSFLESGTIIAYVGDQIRGAQSAAEMFTPTGAYVYKVRLHSNSQSGETVTFRYFDIFDEKVYEITESATFTADAVPDYYSPTVLSAVCGVPGKAGGLLPEDGAVDRNATLDLYWQPADNTLFYSLYLWKEGDPEPATPRNTNISGTSIRVSGLTYGATYHWCIVSANQCLQDTSVTHTFTVRNLPDLVVGGMTATDTILSATDFDVQFTVTNQGAGATPATTWYDAVYLSEDQNYSGSDRLLKQEVRQRVLLPDSSYTQVVTVSVPAEYEGDYYLLVQTDRSNSITETGNSNNFVQPPLPLHVGKKPLPDVKVDGITANTYSYDPGDTIDVSWRVDNIGDAAASGGWTEKVSVVSLSGIRQNLSGTPQFTGVLEQGEGVDRSFRFVFPALIGFEGEAHVEVELVPSNELAEYPEDKPNNKAASVARITMGNRLYLELPEEANEAYAGQLRSYVRRSGNLTQALTVNLAAVESGQINLPSTVTIPERSSSALFNITMIDNAVLEGTREVEVEASATGYDLQTQVLTVLDNEKSAVGLSLDKTAAVEGDTLTLTVSRDLVTADSVVVLLSTSATAQWSFPTQVVLAGGVESADVPVVVTDNTVPELDAEATITGRAGGMTTGSVSALIADDDIPQIEFEIRGDTVAEGAGPYAAWGVIRRPGSTEGEIRVLLSADLANTVYFPSPVILPNGVREREFNIGVVDNDQVDGLRTVELTGSIYIPSCNCGTTAENGGVVTGQITVADNDGPSLKVTVNPVTLKEGVTGAGKVTVTRNTATTNALNIALSSNDMSELEIQATAVIPAGSASVEVSVDTKDDGIDDGSQMVTIRATAADFSPGIAWVNVTDINRPDLEMGTPEIPTGEIVTGRQVEVSATIVNNGYGKAPSGVPVKFYLSKDDRFDSKDQEIHAGTLTDPVGIGEEQEYRKLVTVPGETGDYYLIGKVNPESTVTELLYINNESPAVALTIVPSYNATAEVVEEVFSAPVPVTISGAAALLNGDPAVNTDVDVYVISGNLRRVLEVTTDENGEFTTVFEPYSYEAGRYVVGACYPGHELSDEQDAFDIMGMERSEKGYLTWNIKLNVPETGTIGIRNRSSVPLTEVTFEVLSVPDGMNFMIDTIPVLGGNELSNFNFTVYGETITEGLNYVEVPVRVSSAEGISFEFKAYYYCQALGSHLVSTPASINTTITKDKARYYDLRIVNEGAGETGMLTVALPSQEWMTVASADTIENVMPGDTTIVTLLFTPDENVPLNTPMSGRIVVHNSNGNDLAIPYRVESVSEETGGLQVDVVDEYTYYTEAAPHVQNAHVVVRHPFSGRIVAEGFTGPDGIFEVDSLPEGSYKMTVQADKHEGYQNVVEIDPGRVNEQTVFLAFQAITYTWEVVPTEIEDSYEIELVMEFETNVPAPVVVMEMPKEMPQLFNDETYTFLVTITNKGLITAEDVELRFPEDDPEYEWVTEYSTMDLVAQQAIQVPVTMRIRDGVKKSDDSFKKSGSKSSGPCSDYAMTFYGFECGPDRQWRQAGALFTISGRVCPGDGGGGGGFGVPWGSGGGSGPGPASGGGTSYNPYGGTASTVSPSMGCDPCLNSVLMTILGCVGPPIGAALSCGYGFADGDASWSDAGACIPGPIGCTIGVIGTIETCYNTPPFGMGGGSSGGKKALDALKAKGTTVPPVMYQSAIELDYAMMNDQAERDYISEYFGNSMDWTVKENFRDFTIVTDSVVTNQVPFDAATIVRVKSAMEDTDISEAEVDAFVARWNMTMQAWGAGVRTPNTTYPNIINKDSLDSYYNKMQEALDYALSLGYLSVSDMKYKAWHTLKESTEQGGSSVCASVSIRISQKLVMTREAFEGTLTIFNGNTTTAMEEIKLNIEIRDENGVLSNDLFEIETKALDILTGVDGTGSLGAEQTGSATILFIPEKGAAPEVPVSYSFGGSFSYLDPFTDVTVEKPLFPVTLDVNPSPDLFLHYFMQRDILGDDPLTDEIEPVIPAELAVMIENNGFGQAKNVRIESAQPEIIDNEKGLSIHFELVGSNLNGQPRQLGLTNIDFGNIAPKTTSIGQWWFTSSLLGHFVNYEANVTHLDSRGNPDLSLISGAELHELIRSIRVYGAGDDGINDFLVNDYQDANEQPDVIYLSQGQQLLDVHGADVGLFDGSISSPGFSNTLTVVASRLGWNYIRLDDPGNGRYDIVRIVRNSDQRELPIDNGWLTHVTLPDGNEPVYEDKFHFVDLFEDIGSQEYTVYWERRAPDPPAVLRIDGVPESFVGAPVTEVQVRFSKEIDPATFTWEDMTLRLQGGEDIMDGSVVITQIDALNYQVDLSALTTGNGFYVLTVQAAEIEDTEGTKGLTGKQAMWTQFLDVPVVEEFIGLPDGIADAAFDDLLVQFNLPLDVNTLVPGRFIFTRNGDTVDLPVVVTMMDVEAKLFRISGLGGLMTEDGAYALTVDLPNIATIDGSKGLLQQTVEWSMDTTPPELLTITESRDGGFDEQHITGMELLFSEDVSGFNLAALELWRGDERLPLSQLRFDLVGVGRHRLSQFRLLTYYEGNYTLKLNMLGIYDQAGIAGTGVVEHTWSVERQPPPPVENMRISPDLGYSDTDGITSTRSVALHMEVPDRGERVEVYKNDFGTLTLLATVSEVVPGALVVDLELPSAGNIKLEAHCFDERDNFSVADLFIMVDESALGLTFGEVPGEAVEHHPESISLQFSDRVLGSSVEPDRFALSWNGTPLDAGGLVVQQVSDSVFTVSGFEDAVGRKSGEYTMEVDLTGIEKYVSGRKGTYTATAKWTLVRFNAAPVADAGAGFEMVAGEKYWLDGSGSYDPDNDQLSYEWFAPEGIFLDDPYSVAPSFVAAGLEWGQSYTFMLVVSDGVLTSSDEVTVTMESEPIGTGDQAMNGRMAVYPNPTKDYFTVVVPGGEVEEVKLVDFAGKVVMHRNWTGEREQTFRMEGVAPGVYVVAVHTADEVYMRRLVVL
jgi:hypothetical protein